MKKKEFKSESKRLLDLMINSIYTNKDIFLRELISNASDAIDKRHYQMLTDKKMKTDKPFEIFLSLDKENRTIKIEDNGLGMTDEELEHNLGTIAESGSNAFKQMVKDNEDTSIIGQFGVGFYSAFMVSDKIEVISKSSKSDKAYKWVSSGADGYTIEETTKDEVGTEIILHIKKKTEDEDYDEYLTEYKIKELVKKYSDYIRYPIKMECLHEHLKDKEKNEYETVKEIETLNSMIPIWKKNKKEVKEEDYNHFYSEKYYDYEKPLKVIHTSVEGLTNYDGILFIPSHAPFDFYTKEYEKGLSLYTNGVLIMDKCSDLLPDYFSFVKGVIDTDDLSLNISREMLQKTKALHSIAKSIETKIKKELEDMLNKNREDYIKFFKVFGIQLKFGVYNNYGMDKEKLKDLIMFYSSKKKDYITLKEYVQNMKNDQESIYYACGETIDKIDNMPQVEQVKEKDYEILYLTDYGDEFVINSIMEYDKKHFSNVSDENLDLEDEKSKEQTKKLNEENSEMFKCMKESLNISEVRFTNKLKNHSVCLTSKGEISTQMEKMINVMPTEQKVKAELILEINENHDIANKLISLYKTDKAELLEYTKILYAQARLIEGLPIDNPTEISNIICKVISK